MYMYMYDKGRERGEEKREGGGGRGREEEGGRGEGGREGEGGRSNLRLVCPTPFIPYCFLCLVDQL